MAKRTQALNAKVKLMQASWTGFDLKAKGVDAETIKLMRSPWGTLKIQ